MCYLFFLLHNKELFIKNAEQLVINSIKDNEYLQAVDSVLQCIRSRVESPIYKFDFLFNFSSVGKQFYKGISVMHAYTAKVSLFNKNTT